MPITPKRYTLDRYLENLVGRVRRLEVNRPPASGALTFGIAQYSTDILSSTPDTSYTLDHTLFGTSGIDSVGLTFDAGNIYVPDGWLFWATWGFYIQFNTIVAGDALEWRVVSDAMGLHRRDSLVGMDHQSAEFAGGGVVDYQTAVTLGPSDMAFDALFTQAGTTFFPVRFFFSVWGVFGLPTPPGY